MKELMETWQIHNRINLYLLDAIDEAHLAAVAASKGRTVANKLRTSTTYACCGCKRPIQLCSQA